MSMSEMMTIIIGFHMSHHGDFKSYYQRHVKAFYQKEFPALLSYKRFLEVMLRTIVPMCAYFSRLKGKLAGINLHRYGAISLAA